MSGRRSARQERVRRAIRRAVRPARSAADREAGAAPAERLAFLFAGAPAVGRAAEGAPAGAVRPRGSAARAGPRAPASAGAAPWAAPPRPRYRGDADEPPLQAPIQARLDLREALLAVAALLLAGAGRRLARLGGALGFARR